MRWLATDTTCRETGGKAVGRPYQQSSSSSSINASWGAMMKEQQYDAGSSRLWRQEDEKATGEGGALHALGARWKEVRRWGIWDEG